ncbi:ATP-binding protein [Mucilaginibacter lutimaris]|uniref:ATP-binding protein n=1 Tax=Mucilaginibacter lutimaris TaxID=931629 RepID=A0ABW2ZMT7_9SPHI
MKITIPVSKALLVAALTFIAGVASAQHTVSKLWQTPATLATPESVLPANGILYVSLIDGDAWAKDGKGGIAKVSLSGKIIDTSWVTGLNAPKGMAIRGNWLYIGDVDEVVVVNIKTGKVDHKVPVKGAKGLNDVTVDKAGAVYVSDSMTGLVHKIVGNKVTTFLQNQKGVNGLRAVNDKLYVLTGDGAYIVGTDKTPMKLTTLEHGGDGIEPVGNGDMLATAWQGYLYYIQANGNKDVLLDTHSTNDKTADIGYDAKSRIIYVPTFLGKSVVAYKLK